MSNVSHGELRQNRALLSKQGTGAVSDSFVCVRVCARVPVRVHVCVCFLSAHAGLGAFVQVVEWVALQQPAKNTASASPL